MGSVMNIENTMDSQSEKDCMDKANESRTYAKIRKRHCSLVL